MSSPYEPKSPSLRTPQMTFNEIHDGRGMSSESLSETLQCSIIYYERISVEELLDHYKELCYAVVEFERNASTLRTNSVALTLCRRLFTADFPCLLRNLRHSPHWPSELADLEPGNVARVPRLSWSEKRTIFSAAEALQNTCSEFLRELSEIDGSSLAEEYSDIYRLGEERSGQTLGSSGNLRYFFEMKTAVQNGDKDGMMDCCDALIGYLKDRLRSDTVRQGLRALINKQDHTRNSFMDFATLAIFFSSITASALQFSYSSADATYSCMVVNVCWFASLVLSIASATNSFLGAIVYQSPEFFRRSRGVDHRVLRAWFRFCPPIFLTFSGMLFLVGICVFTFSSTQGSTTQIVTITLTFANLLTLFSMFLLAFTKVIHIAIYPLMLPSRLFVHLIIVSVTFPTLYLLRLFTCIVFPFAFLVFLVRRRRLPRNGECTLSATYVFNALWYMILDSFDSHWIELKKLLFVDSPVTNSSTPF